MCRAMASAPPPDPQGTTKSMGRFGYFSWAARWGATATMVSNAAPTNPSFVRRHEVMAKQQTMAPRPGQAGIPVVGQFGLGTGSSCEPDEARGSQRREAYSAWRALPE